MSKSPFEMLWEFQTAFESNRSHDPKLPSSEAERKLRRRILREEFNEYLDAEDDDDLVGIADALCDMIYIAYGTGVSYGLPMDELFAEVHRSNMSKLDPETGKPTFNEYGKVKKPATYSKPDLAGIIAQHSVKANRG